MTKKTGHLAEISSYSSILQGKRVRALICKRGRKYGVVSIHDDVAKTIDYMHGGEELVTFTGNEAAIIDWVDFEEAKLRYADLLRTLFKKEFDGVFELKKQERSSGAPVLHVIHGRKISL